MTLIKYKWPPLWWICFGYCCPVDRLQRKTFSSSFSQGGLEMKTCHPACVRKRDWPKEATQLKYDSDIRVCLPNLRGKHVVSLEVLCHTPKHKLCTVKAVPVLLIAMSQLKTAISNVRNTHPTMLNKANPWFKKATCKIAFCFGAEKMAQH